MKNLIVAFIVVCSCAQTPTPTPQPEPIPPPPPESIPTVEVIAPSASALAPAASVPTAKVDVRGTIDGKKVAFTSGRARLGGLGLDVVLTEKPLTCAGEAPSPSVSFHIPPSRDDTYFRGGVIGVSSEAGGSSYYASSSLVSVELADVRAGGTLAFGYRLTGKAQVGASTADLAGSATVPVCGTKDAPPAAAPAASPPDSKFVNAIAIHERGAPANTVNEIWIFTERAGSCATPKHPNGHAFLDLSDVGPSRLEASRVNPDVRGDSIEGQRPRGPQPIQASFHDVVPDDITTGGSAMPIGFGEVTWESFDPKPGGTIKGRVVTWSDGKDGMKMTFSARVCP